MRQLGDRMMSAEKGVIPNEASKQCIIPTSPKAIVYDSVRNFHFFKESRLFPFCNSH